MNRFPCGEINKLLCNSFSSTPPSDLSTWSRVFLSPSNQDPSWDPFIFHPRVWSSLKMPMDSSEHSVFKEVIGHRFQSQVFKIPKKLGSLGLAITNWSFGEHLLKILSQQSLPDSTFKQHLSWSQRSVFTPKALNKYMKNFNGKDSNLTMRKRGQDYGGS